MPPAQDEADRHERVGEIFSDQVEPKDVEGERQYDQDHQGNRGEADEFEIVEFVIGGRLHVFHLFYPRGRATASPSDLEDEQALGTQHQERDHDEQRRDLGDRPGREELKRGLRLRDGERWRDGADQALGAAEHHDQERVDDIELAGGRTGGADHGEGRSGDAGNPAAESKGEPVDAPRVDAGGAAHGAVGHDGAHLQTPTRAEQEQRHQRRDDDCQAHHEQAVDLHLDRARDGERAHHPLRQLHADLTRPESRAEGLLHDQAQAPGREQGIERARIEVADEQPFDSQAERARDDERDRHREKEVTAVQARKIGLEQVRGEIGHVGAEDHELPVRHVDHAHLAEDDRKSERHQKKDREQDQAGEGLHRKDRTEFAKRIAA